MPASRYLAIETSSPRLTLALGDERKVVGAYRGTQDWRHADSLFEGIQKLLKKARWTVQSLSGVAVSVGPGSFTGIRIGLAVARALGQFLQVPVVGVSSLEIMAAGEKKRAPWLAPQIDALRGQIFTALYQRDSSGALRTVLPETMVVPADWLKIIKPKTKRESIWISPLKGCYPEAEVLLGLARPRFAKAGTKSYKTVLPLYIRKSSAEERLS